MTAAVIALMKIKMMKVDQGNMSIVYDYNFTSDVFSGTAQNTETGKQTAVMKTVMTTMQMVAKMKRKTTMTVFITILCHDFLMDSKVGMF